MSITRYFENKKIYHIYNRGVAKQNIFRDINDYQRLLDNFGYYLDGITKKKISEVPKKSLRKILKTKPKKPLVDNISFCLMPNHFHLMAKQLQEGGIPQFIRDALNSYSRYFNTKYERVGPIFQGRFKAVEVKDDDQLIHLSRYIHLNPFTAGIADAPENYIWSSFKLFIENQKTRISNPKLILEIIGSPKKYREFVQNYAEYTKHLLEIDNLLLE